MSKIRGDIMRKKIISRRFKEREPNEGYAQTLQLSLIPAARLSIGFWCIMTVVSILLAYMLQDNQIGLYVHITLTLGAAAIALRHSLELCRLKKELNVMLLEHPEFELK